MNPSNYILNLIGQISVDSTLKVSDLVRQSARIARLRNDYPSLWWLEWECINIMAEEQRNGVMREIAHHFTNDEFKRLYKEYSEIWMRERTIDILRVDLASDSEPKIVVKSVYELENDAEQHGLQASEVASPQGLHHLDLYSLEKENRKLKIFYRYYEKSHRDILGRIKNRVLMYLGDVEKQLIYGQLNADIFEENRLYVDRKLGELSPEALEQFISSYQRMKEDSSESWAQALTSSRRLLKSMADLLYPPSDEPVKGSNGKDRKLTEEMYVARLWQYVFEKTAKSTSGRLLQTQFEDYGNRIDRLYEMACKGVHASISRFEVNQCVIQTYILIGDLLRLEENTSAIESVQETVS